MSASALAAVVGAVLASQLGVYGTILGAAVVSIGATTGTAVLQHLFRRTGEQLREMTSTADVVEHPRPEAEPGGTEETQVFDPFDPGGDRTRMMARINPPDQGEAVAVYRGRTNLKPKSWKVYAVTATIVFGLAMGTVGVIEVASGKPAANLFGGDGGGSGGGKPSGSTSASVDPSSGASTDHAGEAGQGGASGSGGQGSGNGSGNGNASPNPGASSSPHPSTSPSQSPDPVTPTPTPHASTGGTATTGTSGDAATPQGTPSA